MKKFLLTSTLLCFGLFAWSQSADLTAFNHNRLQKQKTGMIVLGTWAVGNIAAGLALRKQKTGEEHYFHTMNAAWNGVNLGIAAFAYWSASTTDPGSFGLYESINEHYKFQKILLFNAGLDVGYVLGGLYLMERSKGPVKNPARLKGFGRAIILQGAFLFVFDVANYLVQHGAQSEIKNLLGSLSFTGNEVGLVLRF